MTDLRQIAGDMPLGEQAREQLASFVTRNQVVVIQPARRHAAGWLWTGKLGEAIAAVGDDHDPIKVLTIPDSPTPHVVRFVACLAMRGEINHVLQVTPAFTRMLPVDDPQALRDEITAELPDWWHCPNNNRMRCTCINRHH